MKFNLGDTQLNIDIEVFYESNGNYSVIKRHKIVCKDA